MSVAVTDEAAAFGRLEDGGFEDPEILLGAAEGQDGFGVDAGAMVFLGHPKQLGVGDKLWRLIVVRLLSSQTLKH